MILPRSARDREWWQPTLAFTCRQLRNEVLPLFYARTHFRIEIGPGMTTDPRLKGALAESKQAKRWASCIADEDIGDMREISLHTDLPYGVDYLQDLEFELEITAGGEVVCRRLTEPDYLDRDHEDEDGGTMWDHMDIFNAELRLGIEVLEKAIHGRRWNRKTFLMALGGLRKLKAKAETEDREYDKMFPW